MTSARHRILLVEDDPDVAEMLLMVFQALDYEVLHAEDGQSGLELARKSLPQLVLLDVMLPDMDGYDVCVKLRSQVLTKFIPTIFLTQKDERSAKMRGLELGADDYLTKPFDIDELRLRMERAIQRAHREYPHEARTGLPTGVLLAQELAGAQERGAQMFTCVIAGFKEYGDVYGFMAARDLIVQVSNLLRESLATPRDVLGIQEDHFLLATFAPALEEFTEQVAQRFARMVTTFYTFVDAQRGGLLLDAGTASEHLVPLMSLQFFTKEGRIL